MSDDLDARIAQLQGLIGQDEAQPQQQQGGGFGQQQGGGSVFGNVNQGVQAGQAGNVFGGNNNQGAGNQQGQQGDKAAPRFAKDADERSIFVGGLPKQDETSEEIALMFAHCGPIAKVTLLRDRQTQALKGQAYIEFQTHEAAGRALDSMQQTLFRGQGAPLVVTKKRSKFDESRGRGGAAGGRGRGRGGAGDPMQMMMQAFAAVAGGAFRGGRGGRGGRGRGRGGRGFGGGGGGQPFGGNNNMSGE